MSEPMTSPFLDTDKTPCRGCGRVVDVVPRSEKLGVENIQCPARWDTGRAEEKYCEIAAKRMSQEVLL